MAVGDVSCQVSRPPTSWPDRADTLRPNQNNMTRTGTSSEALQVAALCLCWYAISSANNVLGKIVLGKLPYPVTVTAVQLLSITVYSFPLLRYYGVRPVPRQMLSWSYYLKLVVPLALGKFLTSVFSHVSIWKVPVSYAHTGTVSDLLSDNIDIL